MDNFIVTLLAGRGGIDVWEFLTGVDCIHMCHIISPLIDQAIDVNTSMLGIIPGYRRPADVTVIQVFGNPKSMHT
jgi:hypothetical protein